MGANPLNLAPSTSGASSPISIPLSGGTAVSSSNPVITANFGTFQVGGSKNNASSALPTPASIFGQADSVLSFGGSGGGLLLLAAVAAGAFLLYKKR